MFFEKTAILEAHEEIHLFVRVDLTVRGPVW